MRRFQAQPNQSVAIDIADFKKIRIDVLQYIGLNRVSLHNNNNNNNNKNNNKLVL
jgi:hypothetical protein